MATAQHTVQGRGGAEDTARRQLANEDYTVGWICAISTEYVAAQTFLDEEHEGPEHIATHDNNDYTLGRIGKHNVVIAVLPDGEYGTASAATVASGMLHSFPNVRIGLMVGIGGGAPSHKHDIRLGDIVVSAPRDGHGGVFQYDFGKTIQSQPFRETGFLAPPPTVLRSAVSGIKAQYEKKGHRIQEDIINVLTNWPRLQKKYRQPDASTDRLYQPDITHPLDETDCSASCSSDASALVPRLARGEEDDNPTVHYGLIASANQLMKDAIVRDRLAREKDVLCFEMEAAGLMNHFPCLVIRGICDYADTHKNKAWQGYAAMTAAAYAKDVLGRIPPNKVEAEKRLSELLIDVNKNLHDIQAITNHAHHKIAGLETDSRLNRIETWLSSPNPSTNFNNARAQRHKGTGQWFLESSEYARWKKEHNSFLWLNGIPGCGKTILSSSVVGDLEQDATSRSLVYFYFDFNDVEKQSAEKAIRSLVYQLYCKREELRSDVEALYLLSNEGSRQPAGASLSKLFESMVQQAGEVWIVLDALDECDRRNDEDGSTGGLLPWIRGLRNASLGVHMLVTSRPEQGIKAAIEAWTQATEVINLRSSLISNDINSYIKAKTKAITRWQDRPEIQEKIETSLVKKADGMFRLVSCQIDILKDCLDPRSLQKELVDLPRTLDATYARILQNILPTHMASAKRLLQFLTYSGQPLRVEEAVDVVAVSPSERPRFHPENRMPIPQEVAQYCSSLVILVTREDRLSGRMVTEIQLAHFSVQEYLASDRVEASVANELDEINARAVITEVCLSYLIDLEYSYDTIEEKQQQPLVQYSARYWSTHAAVVEASQKAISPRVKEYLFSEIAYRFGYKAYCLDQPWISDTSVQAVPSLYYASFVGLLYSVQLVLDKGANVDAQGGYYGNALQAASAGGHETVAQLLLDKGANIDLKGGEYSYALQAASARGHGNVVQLLLDRGANVNAEGGHFGNALQAACSEGKEKVVKLLLDRGANVNAEGGRFRNAFLAACLGGEEKVVRLLLDSGVEVSAQSKNYRYARQAASMEGHKAIVELLDEFASKEQLSRSNTATAPNIVHESPNRKRPTDQQAPAELPSKRRKTEPSCRE